MQRTPLKEVEEHVKAAAANGDWQWILKWEGRMEELLENVSEAASNTILTNFKQAHLMCWVDSKEDAAGKEHGRKYVWLEERRIDLLAKMGRFRESALALCELANNLLLLEAGSEKVERFLKKARLIGAAHGFLEVESMACYGLGQKAVLQGRNKDAVQLLRHALAAATQIGNVKEQSGTSFLNLLESYTHALFRTTAIEEVAPLVQIYREAAKAESRRKGQMAYHELLSLRASARLHKARARPHEATKDYRALLELAFKNQHLRTALHRENPHYPGEERLQWKFKLGFIQIWGVSGSPPW